MVMDLWLEAIMLKWRMVLSGSDLLKGRTMPLLWTGSGCTLVVVHNVRVLMLVWSRLRVEKLVRSKTWLDIRNIEIALVAWDSVRMVTLLSFYLTSANLFSTC